MKENGNENESINLFEESREIKNTQWKLFDIINDENKIEEFLGNSSLISFLLKNNNVFLEKDFNEEEKLNNNNSFINTDIYNNNEINNFISISKYIEGN